MSATTCAGAQRATMRRVPTGRGDDAAAKLAKHCGLGLLPWQEEILTLSASTTKGRWSTFENVVIAPRQQGKSFVVVPRVLAGCLVYGERLVVYSAHERKTAQETWLLLRELCEHDVISPYVQRIRNLNGNETIEFTNGSRFKMFSRTKATMRGVSPDCIIFDEAFSLTSEVMASTLPSVSARPNPQIFYFSSAGTWQSEILLGLRRRGHSGTTSRLSYWEWHAEVDDDHRDERVWAKANPSYGTKLQNRESVLRELEAM